MDENFELNQLQKNQDLNNQVLPENVQANLENPTNKKSLRGKFWLFFVFSIFLLLISGSQIYKNLIEPVKYDTPDWLDNQLSPDEEATRTIAELKENDTDGDGLTDYEEKYQYYTSMFLEDTDSDGFTDSEEVALGNDPLCPHGQSCNLLRLITPNTKLADIIEQVNVDPDITVQEAAVSEFRNFLKENGMPQEDLDALTDEDLLNIFRIFDQSNILPENALSNDPTPDEVRQFLLTQPGADPAEINALSDEELLGIAQELLAR
ncbi:thrombospondin type 3 repeat-containing protein [Patescibacteria group bacterium]|nr:thrombospondin type 3 repeat-containing protein [Patescibacteria group bacterium]